MVTRKQIKAFLEGTARKWLMRNHLGFFIRKHIKEQYKWRFDRAKPECHQKGACVGCGCTMPAVLLANKACKVGCYPKMMTKKEWKIFKFGPL